MDLITQGLVRNFSEARSLQGKDASKQFEYFSTNLILNRYFGGDYDLDDIVVGGGGDTGIDAIALVVNGQIVSDIDEFRDVSAATNSLDVTFIFVQSETSGGFDTKKIGQFQFGVEDFFSASPSLPRSQAVSDRAEVVTAIYHESAKFRREHPSCRLFYVTTGRWTGDANLEARRQAAINDLEQTNLFGTVEVTPIGRDGLADLYRRSENAISRTFTFAHKTAVDNIEGVKQAYIGYLDVQQYLPLIRDEDGDIIRRLFYENVRAWQDYNKVNAEIRDTLLSPTSARFVLMNNGVTLIAKRAVVTSNTIVIEDYQIVNGCQTSYVLHFEASGIPAGVCIPFRLVETSDEAVQADIIRATNRQTEVTEDKFIALTRFAKDLEDHLKLNPEVHLQLFYERRLRQYGGLPVDKHRIIYPGVLIRSFASMFLGEPHTVTRSYSSVEGKIGKDIFVSEHKLEPYYVSAFTWYRIDRAFGSGAISSELKPARFHLILAMRLLIEEATQVPAMNSGEMGRFCAKLCAVLWDEARVEIAVLKAAEVVKTISAGNYHRDNIRTQGFTAKLVDECTRVRKTWSC